jgi:uncharacterized protein YcbK (DUF882 family)
MKPYPHLNLDDFDSTKGDGTHKNMNKDYLSIVNKVFGKFKDKYGFYPKVNSGFRTKEKNELVGGKEKSAHLIGAASDIQTSNLNLEQKKYLAKLFYLEGIRRFGMGSTFIHTDIGDKIDKNTYASNVVWNYGNTIEFNPLKLA